MDDVHDWNRKHREKEQKLINKCAKTLSINRKSMQSQKRSQKMEMQNNEKNTSERKAR